MTRPTLSRLETAFRGIFERQYYANNGPLVRELDGRLTDLLGVDCVAVTNESVACMLAARCLAPSGGEVLVPVTGAPHHTRALEWAGLELRPAAASADGMLDVDGIAGQVHERTAALFSVLGPGSDGAALEAWAKRTGVPLVWDIDSLDTIRHGLRGDAAVVSLRFAAGEGAFVATSDPDLASMLRTARNFHGSETFAAVPLRMNAKMSEAQAALALLRVDALGRKRDVAAAGTR